MKQSSLWDDDERSSLPKELALPGSRPALSRQQKRFNQLLAQIEAEKQTLLRWRDYLPAYDRRVAEEILPLAERDRAARIDLVALLDRAMDRRELSRKERDKVCDILLDLLTGLLEEREDPALIALHDKYSDTAFGELQQDDLHFARTVAREVFGRDLDSEHAAATSAEPLDGTAGEAEAAAAPPKRERKQSAKAAARQAQQEQREADATRALREVYRKLVSELHPDREQEPQERERKTALMQQVNQAYKARDLLTLLELQLRIEQLDPRDLADLAEEQLAHYNQVLKEQLQRLVQEREEITAPFLMAFGGRPPKNFTPEQVDRGIDAELRDVKAMLKRVKQDIVSFRDIRMLKASLKDYRIGQSDDEGFDELVHLLATASPPRRGRR